MYGIMLHWNVPKRKFLAVVSSVFKTLVAH